jgi:hypothetical protein
MVSQIDSNDEQLGLEKKQILIINTNMAIVFKCQQKNSKPLASRPHNIPQGCSNFMISYK